MLNSTHPMAGRNRPRMMKRRLSDAAMSPTEVAASADETLIAAARPRPAASARATLPPPFFEAMASIWFLVGSC